jgi:hypothetical protein
LRQAIKKERNFPRVRSRPAKLPRFSSSEKKSCVKSSASSGECPVRRTIEYTGSQYVRHNVSNAAAASGDVPAPARQTTLQRVVQNSDATAMNLCGVILLDALEELSDVAHATEHGTSRNREQVPSRVMVQRAREHLTF